MCGGKGMVPGSPFDMKPGEPGVLSGTGEDIHRLFEFTKVQTPAPAKAAKARSNGRKPKTRSGRKRGR